VGDPKLQNRKPQFRLFHNLPNGLMHIVKSAAIRRLARCSQTQAGRPLDLNACYQREMKDVLKRAGISWHAWHGFRRGLASNLNRLGVNDSVVQRILRHSTVATTQNHYIKSTSPDAIAAMRQFSEALLCSTCAPGEDLKVEGFVREEQLNAYPMSGTGGEGGIRTPDTGVSPYNGLANRRLQPLGHLSGGHS
jgi:hypothetical protein